MLVARLFKVGLNLTLFTEPVFLISLRYSINKNLMYGNNGEFHCLEIDF